MCAKRASLTVVTVALTTILFAFSPSVAAPYVYCTGNGNEWAKTDIESKAIDRGGYKLYAENPFAPGRYNLASALDRDYEITLDVCVRNNTCHYSCAK